MNFSVIAFVVCHFIGVAFLTAMMGKELGLHWPEFQQVGDTSLGRNSIKWMAGLSFIAVAIICFFLN